MNFEYILGSKQYEYVSRECMMQCNVKTKDPRYVLTKENVKRVQISFSNSLHVLRPPVWIIRFIQQPIRVAERYTMVKSPKFRQKKKSGNQRVLYANNQV